MFPSKKKEILDKFRYAKNIYWHDFRHKGTSQPTYRKNNHEGKIGWMLPCLPRKRKKSGFRKEWSLLEEGNPLKEVRKLLLQSMEPTYWEKPHKGKIGQMLVRLPKKRKEPIRRLEVGRWMFLCTYFLTANYVWLTFHYMLLRRLLVKILNYRFSKSSLLNQQQLPERKPLYIFIRLIANLDWFFWFFIMASAAAAAF